MTTHTEGQAGAQTLATRPAKKRGRVSLTPYLFVLPHLIFFAAFLGLSLIHI